MWLPASVMRSLALLLTVFLSTLSSTFQDSAPFPVHPVIPPPPPPWVEQTQTQLEHARIGELEQSLLLEKAQAERLLRELADNRVKPCPPLPPTRPALWPLDAPLCFFF